MDLATRGQQASNMLIVNDTPYVLKAGEGLTLDISRVEHGRTVSVETLEKMSFTPIEDPHTTQGT